MGADLASAAPLYAALRRHDFAAFAAASWRAQAAGLPPFRGLAMLRADAGRPSRRRPSCKTAALAGTRRCPAPGGELVYRPPVPLPVARVANVERMQMLIRSASRPACNASSPPGCRRCTGCRRGCASAAASLRPASAALGDRRRSAGDLAAPARRGGQRPRHIRQQQRRLHQILDRLGQIRRRLERFDLLEQIVLAASSRSSASRWRYSSASGSRRPARPAPSAAGRIPSRWRSRPPSPPPPRWARHRRPPVRKTRDRTTGAPGSPRRARHGGAAPARAGGPRRRKAAACGRRHR